MVLFSLSCLTAASPANSLAYNKLSVTVLLTVDFKSIAYSLEVASIALSTIVFSLPLTVTVPVTMLFVNVVFVPEIATFLKVLPTTVVFAAIFVVA